MAAPPVAPLATYQDLQTAIAKYMNRTDLGDVIPGFIAIAESRIGMTLRASQMLKHATLVQAAGTASIALPVDWLEWDKLFLKGKDDQLSYAPYRYFMQLLDDGNTANCGQYAMEGGNLFVGGPIPVGGLALNVEVSYYAAVPPLAQAATQTNWLMTAHPEVYLYGGLVSGWQYVLDEQRAAANGGLFDSAVQLINSDSLRNQKSGSQWRQRPR